jgi:hypothetical protein
MRKKKTGWPFQEGYLRVDTRETYVFTDYGWNDGSVSRRWHVDPERLDACLADLRPISLKASAMASASRSSFF